MNDKWKNLMLRTLSGLGLVVVVWGAVLWSPWSLAALVAVMTGCGLKELYDLAECRGLRPQRFLGTLTALLLVALCTFVVRHIVGAGAGFGAADYRLFACGLALLLLLPMAMFVCELYRRQPDPLADIAATLLGLFYVALPLSLLLYVPLFGDARWNPWTLIACICIVWSNDVFAYLVGMTCGRRPLFPRLSPKKSWEGFFGGVAGAVAAGFAASYWLGGSAAAWCGLAALTAVVSVLGDLAESMFKRAAGVKDSGKLIPGHGGVLDRFDARLLSAPFILVYLWFVF